MVLSFYITIIKYLVLSFYIAVIKLIFLYCLAHKVVRFFVLINSN